MDNNLGNIKFKGIIRRYFPETKDKFEYVLFEHNGIGVFKIVNYKISEYHVTYSKELTTDISKDNKFITFTNYNEMLEFTTKYMVKIKLSKFLSK